MPWFLQPFNSCPSWSFLWLLLNYGSKIYRFNFYAVILISCSVSSTRRKLRPIIIWVFYKSCRFCIVEIYHLTLEVIFHKNDYVIQHFNKIFFCLIFLPITYYWLFILCLYYTLGWCYTERKFEQVFFFEFISTKTIHSVTKEFGQELLSNIPCNDGSRSFAGETSALKMRR